MFSKYKNLYLQIAIDTDPRTIDHSMRESYQYVKGGYTENKPPLQKLVSAQPSLFAPCVDITRAKLGFGRNGLRILVRQLHEPDPVKQLQAVHTFLDEVQKPESAHYLISYHCVYRLVDLILHDNTVLREKICLILTHLAKIHEGRKAIISRKKILENLLILITKDKKKEIRYAASYTLMTITRDRCSAEKVYLTYHIIPELLKVVQEDYSRTVLVNLRTLENLIEWEQEDALNCNAFEIFLAFFPNPDPLLVSAAVDCMRQLLKHKKARILADEHDMVFILLRLLFHDCIEVVISAVGAMEYATLTTRSRWRAKERHQQLLTKLVSLCQAHNKPPLQLFCLQTLINLCDMPDMRAYAKSHLESDIENLTLRTHEQWDGTSETTSHCIETGHYYRTMCVENIETIKNDGAEDPRAVTVHSYLQTLYEAKVQLIKAINWKSYT